MKALYSFVGLNTIIEIDEIADKRPAQYISHIEKSLFEQKSICFL